MTTAIRHSVLPALSRPLINRDAGLVYNLQEELLYIPSSHFHFCTALFPPIRESKSKWLKILFLK